MASDHGEKLQIGLRMRIRIEAALKAQCYAHLRVRGGCDSSNSAKAILRAKLGEKWIGSKFIRCAKMLIRKRLATEEVSALHGAAGKRIPG
ncbi:hypothetical protein V1279_003559 [Bradyrhizobium sp. AZCC 1610]|uniref:hypothetical protein n=1 Tax=Bradyrhizobium sp. AZCC 1610 TaxID=3117020 RepID=UPI002FF3615B